MNASSPLFQNSISTFLENEKKKLQAQLEQLNKEKQENNQQAKINEQEKQQKIKQQKIRALESEKDCLQEQIDENKKLIEKIQATISKHSQDTSQRSKDDLESLEENIKRKESSLQSHKDIYKKFNEFFEHSVVPNYNRLTDFQKRAFETIYKSASMLPILIIKYLDGFLQFTSDLRKKLKRVKSDAKRIFKSYGEDAVSPIQSEYKKLKEIFVDCFKEFQDCKAIYSPIVLSLNRSFSFLLSLSFSLLPPSHFHLYSFSFSLLLPRLLLPTICLPFPSLWFSLLLDSLPFLSLFSLRGCLHLLLSFLTFF